MAYKFDLANKKISLKKDEAESTKQFRYNTYAQYMTCRRTVECVGISDNTKLMHRNILKMMETSKLFDNKFVRYCKRKKLKDLIWNE